MTHNKWKFNNGIEVYERDFDYDLHVFKVYEGERYLGTVYPASIESMNECIKELNNGNDPIDGNWEDGNGNYCTLDGWDNDEELN